MMNFIAPVTNRTQEDVEFARRNPSRIEENIGARDYRFFNRVLNNMQFLRNYLISIEVPVQPFVGTIWTTMASTILRQADINRMRQDMVILRNVLPNEVLPKTIPNVPDLPWLHFEKLNAIEQILLDIHTTVTSPIFRHTHYWLSRFKHQELEPFTHEQLSGERS